MAPEDEKKVAFKFIYEIQNFLTNVSLFRFADEEYIETDRKLQFFLHAISTFCMRHHFEIVTFL